LRAIRRVSLRGRGEALQLANTGDADIADLTLTGAAALVLVDPAGRRLEADKAGRLIIPLLPAHALLEFTANSIASVVIPAQLSDDISRREHRRIEYYNYWGLAASRVRDWLHYRRRAARGRQGAAR
jgi:hypothetical protein